jgi:hypothetical protein
VIKWLFKFVFRWLWRLGLLFLLLLVLALLLKDAVLRAVVERRVREDTGLDVRIEQLSSSFLSPMVTLRGVRFYNTAEFGGGLFLDISELHIEADRAALSGRKLRVSLVRFNLAELDIVRNEAGETNLLSFERKLKKARKNRFRLPKWLGEFEFTGIDVLNLTFSRVRFIDLKEPQNNREIAVNMRSQLFNDVKSDADVLGILFMIWLRSGGAFP